MRPLILKMSMSLDGFVRGPDGAHGLFGSDEESQAWTLETVWNASLHIMGSHTFREMVAFWPRSTMAFAPPMNQIPKAVFSKQGPAIMAAAAESLAEGGAQGEPLQPGAESWGQAYVASGDLADEIARLKAQDGKPIIAHGGGAFARSLIAHGLVDEYALAVHPIAMGQGLEIFSDLPQPRPLKLVSSKAFPGGTIAQVYRPA